MQDDAGVKAELSKRVVVAAVAALIAIPAIVLIVIMNTPEPPPVDCPPTVAAAKAAEPVASAAAADALERARPFTPEPALATPATAAGKHILAAHRLERDDPERARSSLRRALDLEPKNERALRMLAAKALLDEKHADARELALRCMAVNRSNAQCTQVLKHTPAYTPDLAAALRRFDACLAKEENNALCLAGKAELSFAASDQAGGIAAVERMAKLELPGAGVTLLRGRAKAWTGDYGEARVLFDTACAQGSDAACFRADLLRSEGF
jgi:hypothetical protein